MTGVQTCALPISEDWRTSKNSDELPVGWKFVKVGDLIPKGGIFDGPFGSNLKTSDYVEEGVRVIRLENIGHLHFNGDKRTYISRKKYEMLKRHTVKAGDLIFASFIMDEVRACVLPDLTDVSIAKADCFCLRPTLNLVLPTFLAYELVCQDSHHALQEEVHGATRPRVNIKQLKAHTVRWCPIEEQAEIIRRVESLFRQADTIEARYRKAHAFTDKLMPSVLAKAFRGDL